MHTIQIFGNVLPKSMNVTTPGTQRAEWPDEKGLSMDFEYTIINGDIKMVCTCSRLDAGDFSEIHKRAYHSCRVIVDLVAFSTGAGLLVHLHTVKWTDAKLWPIQNFRQELSALVTAFNLEQSALDSMKALIGQHPNLMLVLNDLIDALNTPNHTPTHCARAIEGIRNHISNSDKDRKRAWKLMNESLRLSDGYASYITDLSQGPRHGDHEYIAVEINAEIGLRSWKIMNRFFEYLKRGQPLPAPEFPTL
jgi:hypothetical protein